MGATFPFIKGKSFIFISQIKGLPFIFKFQKKKKSWKNVKHIFFFLRTFKEKNLFYYFYANLDWNAPDCTDKHREFKIFQKPLDRPCICSTSRVAVDCLNWTSLYFTNFWWHPCICRPDINISLLAEFSLFDRFRDQILNF